ncbi:MAG: response regulator transcription factor [Muribaculaceae bacterium]|nr:response regulator transcription factor [Muribaculaceae bacterium]
MNSDLSTYRFVVADNSFIVRNGLVSVLRHIPGLAATAFDVKTQESLRNYVVMHHPDMVVVNPMFDGLFDVKSFKAEFKDEDIRYVALSSTMVDQNVLSEYDEHFSLYDNPDDIYEKIKKVLVEEKPVDVHPTDSLSNREKEIIVCVVKGLTNKEIADMLCLSIHTVITHRRNISNKLQIRSTAGLTIYAIVNKLVDIKDVKDM